MDVYTGPMLSVITKLDVLLKESILPMDAKDCLESMTRKLCLLQYWFRSWSKTPPGTLDEDERFWLSQFREVFYDAKNLVDCLVVTAQESNADVIGRLFQNNAIGYIEHITVRATEVLIRLRLRLQDLYMYQEGTELVGIDGQKDVLIKSLVEGDEQSKKQGKILCIVGIGGSGKTALAQVVYHQIKPLFDCGAFVTVSLQHSMKEFFTEMLRQLGMENHIMNNKEANKQETQLVSQIREILQNKRYLIVIDDLWNEEYWQRISCCLPNNDYGSRVIFTTRARDIAIRCWSCSYKSIYEIQHLGYIDSKRLFLNRTFGDNISCPISYTDDFDEILKMCGGTPSAIISIALLLSTEVTAIKTWQEVMDFLYSAWKQIATMQVNVQGFEGLRNIIYLIYIHLPGTLKDCLLYLAVHAKNQMIHRTTIVTKWIAEGFIHEYVKCRRQEVASQYFDKLVDMNFIQLVEYGEYIGKEIYLVNYMVLYVLRLISQEEDFATILYDISISRQYMDSVRLSIQCSGSGLSIHTEKMDPFRIRSITIVGPANFYLSNDLVYLRVLDLDGCMNLNNSAMGYICRMILLKYLSLKHTQVTEIPPDIGNLRYLETLDIRQTEIGNLPSEIRKLGYLETLDIRQTKISNLPSEIGELPELKTLSASHTKISCLPPEIGNLQNLETLDASHTQISCLPPEIGQLQNLETLDASHTQISCLPPEIGKLQNLKTLDASHTQISCLPPEIGKLQNLETLDASHTQISCLPPEIGKLQNLETLDASHTQISCLPPEIGKLQNLKTLDASHTQISCLPPEIGKLQNLKTLDASHTQISCLPPEIGKLQNLETLDASHTQISCLPPEIGKLQNLETLDASHTQISCVPQQIGELRNLETLDVRRTQVKELPKEIVQLPKLAHLYFGQSSSSRGVIKLPAGSDQMKSVKVLGTVDSREWSGSAMEEISGLTGVRKLEVVLHDQPADKNQNDRLLSSIGKCEILEFLVIHGDYNPSDELPVAPYFPLLERLKVAGRFVKVPRWLDLLKTMKKIDIRVCKLSQDDLKILGGLPVLSTLALALISMLRKKRVTITSRLHSSTCTDLHPVEETCPTGFTSLEVFSFDCHLPWITFEEGAMPRLKDLHLKLYACPAGKFPSGITNLHSLEKIILQYSSEYASSSGVTKTVAAVWEEASCHRNLIDLSVNGYHEELLPNTRVDETVTGTEIEEDSNHGNLVELSVDADQEVLDARVDETVTSSKIEDASNHGNPMDLSVDGDHEVLLPNSRADETVTGTEIKECY